MASFTYASGFTAIISNQSTQQYKTDTPNNEPPIDDVMPDKNLIMTVGLHKPWSSGYHREYNYSTSSARPTQLGDLNPNSQAEYRIRALTSYTEPRYANTVLEIDGDYTTTGDRYIDAFEVERT